MSNNIETAASSVADTAASKATTTAASNAVPKPPVPPPVAECPPAGNFWSRGGWWGRHPHHVIIEHTFPQSFPPQFNGQVVPPVEAGAPVPPAGAATIPQPEAWGGRGYYGGRGDWNGYGGRGGYWGGRCGHWGHHGGYGGYCGRSGRVLVPLLTFGAGVWVGRTFWGSDSYRSGCRRWKAWAKQCSYGDCDEFGRPNQSDVAADEKVGRRCHRWDRWGRHSDQQQQQQLQQQQPPPPPQQQQQQSAQ